MYGEKFFRGDSAVIKYNVIKNVETINEIIQIETNAQEMIKDAKREQAELPQKIAEILDTYKNKYHEETAEKIKFARVLENEMTKEKIDLIYKNHDEKLEKLKKISDENMNSWVEKIYSFVLTPTEIE